MSTDRTRLTVTILLLSSCGGSDTTGPPPPPTVASVDVSSPQMIADAIGVTVQLNAIAKEASGATISGRTFVWSSSNVGVATVSSLGLATTRGNGTTQIRASVDGVTGSATLNVQQEYDRMILSADSLVLDRWGDTERVTAEPVDPAGTALEGSFVVWSSSDPEIAAVDGSGAVTTWLGGEAILTAEVMLNAASAPIAADSVGRQAGADHFTAEIPVHVAVQRNPLCQVPNELPVRPAVAPPANWVEQEPNTTFTDVPEALEMRPITLDADLDGDPDLLLVRSSPQLLGLDVVPETSTRVWLNEGMGVFSDGTEEMLGGHQLPWDGGPFRMFYHDFNQDGLQDVFIVQTGWELDPSGCGDVAGSCNGGPNLLLIQQRDGGLRDLAPTNLHPYDTDGYTHSGGAADVDCDGDVDLFEGQWGNADAPAPSHLQINVGGGVFFAEDDRLPSEMEDFHGVPGAVFCDLDRDGDPDLITGQAGNGSITRVSVNDGFGHFRVLGDETIPGPWGVPQAQFECGDLNLDGFPDAVLGMHGFQAADPRGMGVYFNNGDMTFTDVTGLVLPPSNSSRPNPVQGMIDVNGDGWLDLVPHKDEAIYWNAGDGMFIEQYLQGFCCGREWIIADFDGDGRLDIHLQSTWPGQTDRILWNR